MKKFFFCLLFFLCYKCLAQQDSLLTVLNDHLHLDSLHLYVPKRVAFDFQFDNRTSFIQNMPISIQGFNPGVVINQKFRWGLGLYWVKAPYQTFRSSKKSSVSSTEVATNRELNMYFTTPSFRYIFLNAKWVQASVDLAVGFGIVDYLIKDQTNTNTLAHKEGLFIPSGAGVELVLIPIRWIGVAGSIGYRKSLKTYDINADFDGMYYSYGIKIFLGRIYKDLVFHRIKKHYNEEVKKVMVTTQ